MTHLKCISLPQKAATLAKDRHVIVGDEEGVVNILDTVFGFVIELVTIKGKGE